MEIHTKVFHVEDLGTAILGNCSKELPVGARRHTSNGLQVGTVVFDELNTDLLLLPQLHMAIDRCGDEEVCPEDAMLTPE